MSKDVLDTLVDIRYWFRDQNRWVEGALARDMNGGSVTNNLVDNSAIVGMCVSGAAYLKAGISNPDIPDYHRTDEQTAAFALYQDVMRELQESSDKLYPDCDGPVDVNDNLGYDAVMKMLDHAITRVARPLYEAAAFEYENRKAAQRHMDRLINGLELKWLAEQADVFGEAEERAHV